MIYNYKIKIKEQKFHEKTVGKRLAFGCTYDLILSFPIYNYHHCHWNNWNEYLNKITVT